MPTGRAAAEWVVVTDDRELGRRVRERGGRVRSLGEWRRRGRRSDRRTSSEPKLSSRDVAEWEAFFERGRDDEGG
jgi:hypothetical protein